MKLEKRYIIRKYIMARSAAEALRKEKYFKADECWVDEKWFDEKRPAIGFIDNEE